MQEAILGSCLTGSLFSQALNRSDFQDTVDEQSIMPVCEKDTQEG